MITTFRVFTTVICLISSVPLSADPNHKSVLGHPKSACVIESTVGEYPHYFVKRNGKVIYMPESDGISAAAFSPQGTRIAFLGSEVNGVDIPGEDVFPVVILECKSARLRGYQLRSVSGRASWKSESVLEYVDNDSAEKTLISVTSK